MRADRLLSILMLLQARGKMTAVELATELEVSERTIYRDIDALSVSGVPVYGEAGPHGGYALMDEYRTQLTGLTEKEARALFMLSIPAPLEPLGVDDDLRAAMRKLSASLSAAQRGDQARVRQRFLLDARWWRQSEESAPLIQLIHKAVWNDHRLVITYRTPFSDDLEYLVSPYALVAKAGVWHLVFLRSKRWRVKRVSELSQVLETGESFERDAVFDLRSFWDTWCERHEALGGRYLVRARVAPTSVAELKRLTSARLPDRSDDDDSRQEHGWAEAVITFESLEAARTQLLGFGSGIEVLEPLALRRSMADFAAQIVGLYRTT